MVGLLINSLKRANAAQTHTLGLLKYKHKIIRELTKLEDWEDLTVELAKIPSTFAGVSASRLFLRSAISGELEAIAFWSENGTEEPNFYRDCRECLKRCTESELVFSVCTPQPVADDSPRQYQEYCLPIEYANGLFALVHFKLKPGENLSNKQIEMLDSIRDDMALVLKAGHEQEKLFELRQTQSVLTERHSISTYLHDHLSQNLAYLCLKLNQFTSGTEQLSADALPELQRMHKAADQSYEIVRGFLETIYPETTPHLVNLISAQAKNISQRARISISIEKFGEEVPLLPDTQQAIFYVVREALSNIEKHSRAKNAKVLIAWGQDCLTITISDNGVGFYTRDIDGAKHFGMEIMQERIQKINGRIDIQSSEALGTEVTFTVPLVVLQKED